MKYCVKIIIDLFQGQNILYYYQLLCFFWVLFKSILMLTTHASNVFKKGSRHGVCSNNVTYWIITNEYIFEIFLKKKCFFKNAMAT